MCVGKKSQTQSTTYWRIESNAALESIKIVTKDSFRQECETRGIVIDAELSVFTDQANMKLLSIEPNANFAIRSVEPL